MAKEDYPLITYAKFMVYVPIMRNMDEAKVAPEILYAQIKYIKPQLDTADGCGSSVPSFYAELVAQVETGSLTAANSDFLQQYLWAAHANYTYSILVGSLVDTQASIGNIQQGGGMGQSVSPEHLSDFKTRQYVEKGNVWLAEGVKFLDKYPLLYPTYKNQKVVGQAISPPRAVTGLFLKDRHARSNTRGWY